MSYTDMSHLGVQHSEWLRTIEFYENELGILQNRLTEVAGKNTLAEASAGVEHFQNQFIVQRNTIDELKHTINKYAHTAFEDVKNHAGKVEKPLVGEHQKIDDSVKQFEKVINDLRHEFNLFLTKWM